MTSPASTVTTSSAVCLASAGVAPKRAFDARTTSSESDTLSVGGTPSSCAYSASGARSGALRAAHLVPTQLIQRSPKGAARRNLWPCAPRALGTADARFVSAPVLSRALSSIIESYSLIAQDLFASDRRLRAPLGAKEAAVVAAFRHAIVDACETQHSDPFRAFIGVVDLDSDAAPRAQPRDHYALRRLALFASAGALQSWEAFTFTKRTSDAGIWPFLEDMRNWLPERQKVQHAALSHCLVQALATSHAIGGGIQEQARAHLVLTAGPYGSGKTSELHRRYDSVLGEGQALGIVGPDALKIHLKAHVDGGITSASLHKESSQLAYALTTDCVARLRGTYLLDSSLAQPSDLSDKLRDAPDASVTILAFHIPLHISVLRMLMRPVAGLDPRIAFRALVQGWTRTVQVQAQMREIVRGHMDRCSYTLIASDTFGHHYKQMQSASDDTARMPSSEVIDTLARTPVRCVLENRALVLEGDAAWMGKILGKRILRYIDLPRTPGLGVHKTLRAKLEREPTSLVSLLDLPLEIALDAHAHRSEPWADDKVAGH